MPEKDVDEGASLKLIILIFSHAPRVNLKVIRTKKRKSFDNAHGMLAVVFIHEN